MPRVQIDGDPRAFDLRVRTITTAAIALIITAVAAYAAINTGHIPIDLAGWGALVIGFYFGSHSSMNGAGARARQDVAIAEKMGETAATATAAATAAEAARAAAARG